MRVIACALATLAAACGRVGFDSPASDATPSGDGTVDTQGLIGWWKLDESTGTRAVDSTAHVDGALEGPPFPVWMPFDGRIGGALAFPGDVRSFVGLGTPAAYANLPAVTVVAWLQPTNLTVSLGNCVFDHGETPDGWYVGMSQVTMGDIVFGANFSASNTVSRQTTGGQLATGVWARVVATWDGTNVASGIHIYVDGVEAPYAASTDATGTRAGDSLAAVTIGCNAGLGYSGLLDDVRLYNRALAADEIGTL